MNRRLCIVQVISNLEYGGAQRQVVELANHLNRERFDVHVCSLSEYVPLADELEDHEHRLHIIRKRFKFDFSVVPRLAKAFRSLRADVVHGYLFDAEIASRLAGRRARVAAIIGSERNTDYHIKHRQRLAYRITRSQVDMIIANSSAGAKFNRRMLGHPRSQYRVIHNGVNTERFSPGDGVAIRKSLGIRADEQIVGMFGSFKRQKNHPLLFSAFRRLLDRHDNLRLMLVGDELHAGMHGSDAYKQDMESLVDKLGLRPRCIVIGNQKDVERLYGACDVTVLPSLFEGTPNVLLESMACRVPVVATDVSDNKIIVPDGVVGFVVPLGDDAAMADRIERLLIDPDLKIRMGTQAREWVLREFSCAQLASKTAEVYEQALAARRDADGVRYDRGSSPAH